MPVDNDFIPKPLSAGTMKKTFFVHNLWSKLKQRLSDPRRDSGFFYYTQTPPAGITVTHENALTYSAVWSCVRIISETISSLSCHAFHTLPNKGKERVHSRVDRILSLQSNPEMSAQTFKETIIAWTLLWGNGYAEIERDKGNQVAGLWPIHPERVEIERSEEGSLVYLVSNYDGSQTTLAQNDMFHVKGLGHSGLKGYSVVSMAANAISLGMACETFGAKYFGSGTNPGSVFEIPGKLSQSAYDRLKKDLDRTHAGLSNAKKNMILEEGMTHKHLAVSPEDSQFIETRRLQIEDIARFFRMPLHKMADLTNSSFSNIEQQNIEFVTDTIWPWVTRFEAEANIKLFPARTKGTHFCKININSLLRGDVQTRSEYYRTMLNIGVMSVNEIRELEDLNPIGKEGDSHYMQLNMTTLDSIGNQVQTPDVRQQEESGFAESHMSLFSDAFTSLAKFESARITGGLRRYSDRTEFAQWLQREMKKHRQKATAALSAPAVALYKMITKFEDTAPIIEVVNQYCGRYVDSLYEAVMEADAYVCNNVAVSMKATELINLIVKSSTVHKKGYCEKKNSN